MKSLDSRSSEPTNTTGSSASKISSVDVNPVIIIIIAKTIKSLRGIQIIAREESAQAILFAPNLVLLGSWHFAVNYARLNRIAISNTHASRDFQTGAGASMTLDTFFIQ